MKLPPAIRGVALLLGVALASTAVVASAQTLSSDRPDYVPGDIAILAGSGFAPGEVVVLQVRHADDTPDSGANHQTWVETADENGGFVGIWIVCGDDCVGSTLLAVADGQASGLHAETSFTDAGPVGPPSDTPRSELFTANGTVTSIVEEAGTVYISGSFTRVIPYTGGGVPIDAVSGSPVAGFPKVDGSLRAVVSDGSGGWYIGGSFARVGGITRNNVAHIDAGNNVTAWDPSANGQVITIVTSGSSVYVGGFFSSIGGAARDNIAEVDATTGLATAWDPGANNAVNTLAVSGSTVYAGGQFTSIGGAARNRIAALDATTGLATTWDPNANGTVFALAVSGSTVYVGGTFGSIGGAFRNNITALDATTGLATAWNPGASSSVNALAVSGSTVYAGGQFTTIGGAFRNRIAALDATTGLATAWNPNVGAGGLVFALAVDGGTVYVGGSFTTIGAATRNFVAALDATTGLVTAWDPNATNTVFALAVSGSTVYVGGFFNGFGGVERNRIAALDATTGLPTAWDPNANGTVLKVAVNGSTVYASGQFTVIGGASRNRIAALDATTGLATAWDPNANGQVNTLKVSGSTIYAGGFFTNIGGAARNRIAALDATTGLATAWDPNANSTVTAIAVDGSTVYVGGAYTAIGGAARNRIAALDATTGLAAAWDPNANNAVNTLVVSGSTVYAGGLFTSIGGAARDRIATLDATSGLASAWNPGANGNVVEMTVGASTVYAGGAFSSIGGDARRGFAGFTTCAPPTISFCPPDVTVECGGATDPASTGEATAGGAGVTVSYADAFVAGCGNSGVITRTWTATGACGTASCAQQISIVDDIAPVVTITGPASGAVYAVGTPVSFTASFTDDCGSPHAATWTFDATAQPGTVVEGAPGAVSTEYTFTTAGVYLVSLTVADACGNAGTTNQVGGVDAMVVIYDPNAGFVTGGGWIDSPPGAYPADPMLAGKANFGFVSKYKKGASTPTGETEFQFKVANLNFHSTSYEWLVVSGARAQYKGSGTINGAGSYGFILTCVDGQLWGGVGEDKLRMKITDKGSGALVYDNQFNAADSETPTTVLGGGSIVIQPGGNAISAEAGRGSGEVGGTMPLAGPTDFALAQNYPNPFDRSTRITFGLPEPSRVSLVVYDLGGREIRTLVDGELAPGWHSQAFNRTDERGRTLGAGIYFLRMSAQSVAGGRSFTALRKFVLVQ